MKSSLTLTLSALLLLSACGVKGDLSRTDSGSEAGVKQSKAVPSPKIQESSDLPEALPAKGK